MIAALFLFFVLPACGALCLWISEMVFPDMWRVGMEFGRSPTTFERVFRKATAFFAVLCFSAWMPLVVWAVAFVASD